MSLPPVIKTRLAGRSMEKFHDFPSFPSHPLMTRHVSGQAVPHTLNRGFWPRVFRHFSAEDPTKICGALVVKIGV